MYIATILNADNQAEDIIIKSDDMDRAWQILNNRMKKMKAKGLLRFEEETYQPKPICPKCGLSSGVRHRSGRYKKYKIEPDSFKCDKCGHVWPEKEEK